MKSQPTITIDDTLLAVAERQADSWRVLLVRRGDRPTILDARVFAASDEGGIATWLQSQHCGDLRIVLPASATIVRMITIPVAAPMQMLAALRLHAEGMFLGSVPLVRIGLGVLSGASDGERQGVIMAWPGTQVGISIGSKLEAIARYVPEPAAMLVLASADHPAIAADRTDGSIAIAMYSPKGMVIRATRETAATGVAGDEAWNEGLRSALVETALNAGIEPARITAFLSQTDASTSRTGDRVLMLDPEIQSILAARLDVTVAAAEHDADWWRDWAIALGAAVVSCGPLSELSRLRRLEERNTPSRIDRFVERYSQPSRALRVAVLAFLVAGLAPIGAAWARGKVLEFKMPDSADKFETAQRDIEHRIALYGELSKRTLPVAKILGDLACCTPDGVEIESIQLSASQGVTVRGVAKAQGERSAAEIVNSMARLMDASGVFDKTHWRWNTPDGRGIFKFDLDALIARPTMIAKFPDERDWAVKTLSQRKYSSVNDDSATTDPEPVGTTTASASATPEAGDHAASAPAGAVAQAGDTPNGAQSADGGSPSIPTRGIGRRTPTTATPEANSNTPAVNPSTPAANPARPTDTSKPATFGSGVGSGGGPAATAQANLIIPDPFTDEQLKAMSKEEARTLLSEISKARRRNELDAETRKRLTDDFQRILDHLKK